MQLLIDENLTLGWPAGLATTAIPRKQRSIEDWQELPILNPMVGVIEGFRWAITGVHQFRRMEKHFADVI